MAEDMDIDKLIDEARKSRVEQENILAETLRIRDEAIAKVKSKSNGDKQIEEVCKTLGDIDLSEYIEVDDVDDVAEEIQNKMPLLVKVDIKKHSKKDILIIFKKIFGVEPKLPESLECRKCKKKFGRGKKPKDGICKDCRPPQDDFEKLRTHWEDIRDKAKTDLDNANQIISKLQEKKTMIEQVKKRREDADKEMKAIMNEISPKKQKK